MDNNRSLTPEPNKCPACKTHVWQYDTRTGTKNTTFPFCSKRCQMVDLSAWLGSKYTIPAIDTSDIDEN